MTQQIFAGLKVADLTWAGVGPIALKYLADHGATVVRVESSKRPDVLRVTPPFKEQKPGINRSQFFANFNSSKLGLAVNMATPAGRDVLKRLVAWADVVAEAYTPGTVAEWGLSYEDVREINPTVIMLSTSQQGQSGPHSPYAGFGHIAAAMAGYNQLLGWPDREPIGPFGAYSDFLNPALVCAAIVGALDYRRRTGCGQYLDLAQYEGAIHYTAPVLMDYDINGRVMNRDGNRSPYHAPHNAYPCQGHDRWLVIAVGHDDEWHALVEQMGRPAWAQEERFSTLLGRKRHEADLDQRVGEWTRQFDAHELMARLQAAGVPAGVVQNAADLRRDPQLAHREFFVPLQHSEMGEVPYDGLPFTLSATPGRPRAAAPCLGEHNFMVLSEFLGYSPEEIGELTANGVLE